VESEPGRGTLFRLRFKECTRQTPAESVVPQDKVGPLNVLVVDDEPMVRDLLARLLAEDGHRVRATSDPHEALRVAVADFFDLVITDQSMPLMNGERLAAAVKASCPATRVLLVTGLGVEGIIPNNVDLVLGKPFTSGSLREGIAEVFAAPSGAPMDYGEPLAATH
jgi:CheY-like chemotaxis protein